MSSSVVGPGQVIAGRYRIERWLGQGGMGSVYQAVQLSVQRTVALKRLVDEHLEDRAHVERFEREALALSRLSHQSTVRLFDFGTDERGCPFIVMEYLEGVDLATDLDRHGAMRWDQALQVSLSVLGSLDEAHAAGIVHRDIKPANLFLCAGPDWPRVKVLDFGIAGGAEPHAGARKLTLTGTVLGSAPYMSPEQARGMKVTPAADLYSFGVVLFEMLTGKTPFEGRSLTAQLLAKVLEPAPALGAVCPGIDAPAEVHALVAALLERDPARRPASARATAERVATLLSGAALPALSRAAQRPARARSGVPKTEPMTLPPTLDDGAPPWVDAAPRAARSRAALGGGLGLVALAASAAVWLAWPPEAPPNVPVAALRPRVEAAQQPGAPLAVSSGRAEVPSGGAPAPDSSAPTPAGAQPPAPDSSATNPALEAPRGSPRPERGRRSPEPPRAAPRATPAAPPSLATAPPPPPRLATPAVEPAAPAPARVEPARVEPARVEPAAPAAAPPPAPTHARSTPEPSVEAASPAASSATRPDTLLPGASLPLETRESPASPAPSPSATPPAATPSPPSPSPAATDGRRSTARAPRERPSAPSARTTDPRYWTISTARAAAQRGEITPAQRNEIIAALQRRRLDARARAARDYRRGRIDYEALLERQRAIDRRIEGW